MMHAKIIDVCMPLHISLVGLGKRDREQFRYRAQADSTRRFPAVYRHCFGQRDQFSGSIHIDGTFCVYWPGLTWRACCGAAANASHAAVGAGLAVG